MEGSRRDLGSQEFLQHFGKFHEHEVLFQFSFIYESLDLPLGRANCIDMLRMLKPLSISFLGYAVENRLIILAVFSSSHISILRGTLRAGFKRR